MIARSLVNSDGEKDQFFWDFNMVRKANNNK